MKTYKWFVAAVAWLPLGLVCPEARGADPVKAAPAGDKAKARPPAAAARPLVGLARAGDIGIAGDDLGRGPRRRTSGATTSPTAPTSSAATTTTTGNRWLVQQWPQAVVDRSATLSTWFSPRGRFIARPQPRSPPTSASTASTRPWS